MTVNSVCQVTRMAGVSPALPERAGRVCCANNLLGGLTHRWPTKPPSSWGQSSAFWGLDPRFFSLRLCLLAGSARQSSLSSCRQNGGTCAGQGKKTSWLGWHPDGPRTAQGLGAGQRPSGLDPCDVGLGLYLRTSVCLISLESENQDGGESLVTGGRQSSEVASVR